MVRRWIVACSMLTCMLQPFAVGAEPMPELGRDGAVFGEWFSGRIASGRLFALTINAGAQVLVQSCEQPAEASGAVRCTWEMIVSEPCNTGEETAVLGNTSNLAVGLNMKCMGPFAGPKDRFRYAFSEPKKIDTLTSGSGDTVAFAIPSEGDEFRIVRFRTAGLEEAVKHLEKMAAELPLQARGGAGMI